MKMSGSAGSNRLAVSLFCKLYIKYPWKNDAISSDDVRLHIFSFAVNKHIADNTQRIFSSICKLSGFKIFSLNKLD